MVYIHVLQILTITFCNVLEYERTGIGQDHYYTILLIYITLTV